MSFFLEKQLIKLSCTYEPLSFSKVFKKLELIQSSKYNPFLGPKWSICPEQTFFGANHYYYFHLPIGPFYCANFLKILTVNPELWRCPIFGSKMVHLPQTKSFWKKKLIFFLSAYWRFSLCKIFKTFLERIQNY